jgi:predicted DCC family thiol-disulfide oxidoreductase YuxK
MGMVLLYHAHCHPCCQLSREMNKNDLPKEQDGKEKVNKNQASNGSKN